MIKPIEVEKLYPLAALPFEQLVLVYVEGEFKEARLITPTNKLGENPQPVIVKLEHQVSYYDLHEVTGWIPLLKYVGT